MSRHTTPDSVVSTDVPSVGRDGERDSQVVNVDMGHEGRTRRRRRSDPPTLEKLSTCHNPDHSHLGGKVLKTKLCFKSLFRRFFLSRKGLCL